ncbi:MAG: hypothetical protein NZO16_05960 [Deltaproteobacteria bacterium]|nr:hypothetical protein [Deltaproteobacteria bacterium]
MTITKALLLPIMLLVTMSCGLIVTYEQKVYPWIGRHVDSLIVSWGPPSHSYDLSDGGKVIQYKKDWSERETYYYDYNSRPYIYPVQKKCITNFHIDSYGYIRNVTFTGDCQSYQAIHHY